MVEKTLRNQLQTGKTVVGTFQIIQSPIVAEIAGLAGLDFIIFDQEHGPLTAESTLGLCAIAECGGTSPIVRVRRNTESEIQRALDVGASGVQIPQVETPADAIDAVRASRFAPEGSRGLSQYVRAGDYIGNDTYTEDQNEAVAVIIHVEGKQGVENIDEILAVDGIDVIFLGPYDLSQSLGVPGQIRHDRVESMMEKVCERAGEYDRAVGTYADDKQMARQWIQAGVQYIAHSVDAREVYYTFQNLHGDCDRYYDRRRPHSPVSKRNFTNNDTMFGTNQ